MQNLNPIEKHANGKKYRPSCSGWKVFPDGRKCKGCEDCLKPQTMATAKKTTAKKKTPAKKSTTAKKMCRKVIKQEGINQTTGRLKAGYKYKKGGGVVKVTPKKAVAKKKKPAAKKKTAKK